MTHVARDVENGHQDPFMSSTPEPPGTRLFLSLLLLAWWFIPRLALFLLSDDCQW